MPRIEVILGHLGFLDGMLRVMLAGDDERWGSGVWPEQHAADHTNEISDPTTESPARVSRSFYTYAHVRHNEATYAARNLCHNAC
jgi:hypothetical protein